MTKVCPSCGLEYPDTDHFCAADGTPLRSTGSGDDDLVGTVIADRYLISAVVGEGGMGRVYRARHVRVPREAAIKVLRKSLLADPYAVAAFNREARNAAMVGDHPNVAAVYDFGETPDGLVYLAMEFVEGETLARLLEREPVLAPGRGAEIVRQIAAALTAAHELPEPVVHRDLKPDNIILKATRDGTDWVKVVDFGIAKAARRDTQLLTTPGLVVGTPRYMSPEQLTGGEIDVRSDVYALALIAFQMLTGRMPFPSMTRSEEATLPWALKRLTTPASPLAAVGSDAEWPDSVQAVFDRALAHSAADRFATAAEFSSALSRALDEPSPQSSTVTPTIGAPATRAGAAPAAAAVGIGVDPAPPVHTGSSTGRPASSPLSGAPRQARMLAWLGGGAAVVTLVAAGLIFARRPGSSAVAPTGGDSAAPPVHVTADSSPARAGAAGDSSVRPSGDTLGTPTERSTARTDARAPADPSSSERAGERGSDRESGSERPKDPARGTATRTDAVAEAARVRAALDRIRTSLADPVAVTAATAEGVLRDIGQLLATLTTSADSVEASYYAVEANLLLDRPNEACRVLLRIREPASGTRFEGRVETFLANRELNCRAP